MGGIGMMVSAEISKDETLIRQGEVGDAFYYIEKGYFNVSFGRFDNNPSENDATIAIRGKSNGEPLYFAKKSLYKINSIICAAKNVAASDKSGNSSNKKNNNIPHARSQSLHSLLNNNTEIQLTYSQDVVASLYESNLHH